MNNNSIAGFLCLRVEGLKLVRTSNEEHNAMVFGPEHEEMKAGHYPTYKHVISSSQHLNQILMPCMDP